MTRVLDNLANRIICAVLLRVVDAFTSVACVRSQLKRGTYVLRVTRSCFRPGMVGREMATGRGHAEMGTGRMGVRVQKWGWRGMQAVANRCQGEGKGWLTDVV